MEDYSKKIRKKNRFIFEIRYSPKLKLLDKKGELINCISPKIVSTYPHWQINQSDILFLDNVELPTNEFLLGLKRTLIVTEDIVTYSSYQDNVRNLIRTVYELLELDNISRMGFRIISTYESDKIDSFEKARNLIEETFLKDPLNLGLNHKDLMIKIEHSNGFYMIGPIKRKENWIANNFKNLKDNKSIPQYGIGLDIDSYGNDIDIKKQEQLLQKTLDTMLLSKSIEDALMKSLDLI